MKKALLMAPMGSVHRRFNQANIDALLSLGYEVHLLANFEDGDGPEQQNQEYAKVEEGRGITVHSIPYVRHSLIRNLKYISATKKLFKNEKFNLIHTHTETGAVLLRLSGKKKSNYFYTSHGFSFYKGCPFKARLIYKPIEKYLCHGMDINIAINSEDFSVQNNWNKVKSRFVHGIGLNLNRFNSAENEINTIRKEFGIPNDSKIVLSIGELDDNKNHKTVIEAISFIKDIDIYYIICGVGPNKERLLQTAKKCGVESKVIFAGYRKDIPDVIFSSDLFVFPSFHEGLPVALMEAMASGLPIVASNIRGVNDLIQDGVNGYLAKSESAQDFASKLEMLLNNPSRASVFANKSKEIVERYSYSKVYEELKMLYSEIEGI